MSVCVCVCVCAADEGGVSGELGVRMQLTSLQKPYNNGQEMDVATPPIVDFEAVVQSQVDSFRIAHRQLYVFLERKMRTVYTGNCLANQKTLEASRPFVDATEIEHFFRFPYQPDMDMLFFRVKALMHSVLTGEWPPGDQEKQTRDEIADIFARVRNEHERMLEILSQLHKRTRGLVIEIDSYRTWSERHRRSAMRTDFECWFDSASTISNLLFSWWLMVIDGLKRTFHLFDQSGMVEMDSFPEKGPSVHETAMVELSRMLQFYGSHCQLTNAMDSDTAQKWQRLLSMCTHKGLYIYPTWDGL